MGRGTAWSRNQLRLFVATFVETKRQNRQRKRCVERAPRVESAINGRPKHNVGQKSDPSLGDDERKHRVVSPRRFPGFCGKTRRLRETPISHRGQNATGFSSAFPSACVRPQGPPHELLCRFRVNGNDKPEGGKRKLKCAPRPERRGQRRGQKPTQG